MPRPIPAHVDAAIRAHLRDRHQIIDPDPREIGAPTASSETVTVTWKDDPADPSGAWFTCRRCPEGGDFYRAEIGWPTPTPRLANLICAHLKADHDRPRVTAKMIATKTSNDEQLRSALVVFGPASPLQEASITCRLCRPGMNQIFLGRPPYRDARRHALLPTLHPELRQLAAPHAGRSRADVIEHWDRRLDAQRHARTAHTALAEARRGTHQRDDAHVTQARRTLLHEKTRNGEKITHAITTLHQLAKTNPAAFTHLIGQHIPALADLADREPPDSFTTRTLAFLGREPHDYLTTSRSTLWNDWRQTHP